MCTSLKYYMVFCVYVRQNITSSIVVLVCRAFIVTFIVIVCVIHSATFIVVSAGVPPLLLNARILHVWIAPSSSIIVLWRKMP